MAESIKSKVDASIQILERRFGRYKLPAFLPPPSSADASAALSVASKNCELIVGSVLGLHGPPQAGFDAARKLMAQFVDWNEVRVSNPALLTKVLGRDVRAAERLALLQRFLEAFFLRQRNLNLECLVPMKPNERRQFLSDLEIFNREELAAVVLSCFGFPVYPPAGELLRVALRLGLLRSKATALQMAKEFESKLEAEALLNLYAHLSAVAFHFCHAERPQCALCPLKLRCPAARAFAKAAKK